MTVCEADKTLNIHHTRSKWNCLSAVSTPPQQTSRQPVDKRRRSRALRTHGLLETCATQPALWNAPVKPVAVHLLQANRQLIAPAVAAFVSTRVEQLQLKAPHVWLGVDLRHHQLALVLRCGLRQVEPVEAPLNGPNGLKLPVSCGAHLMVCGAKSAQVQAAGASGKSGSRQYSLLRINTTDAHVVSN
jgi:hypothetical protein